MVATVREEEEEEVEVGGRRDEASQASLGHISHPLLAPPYSTTVPHPPVDGLFLLAGKH